MYFLDTFSLFNQPRVVFYIKAYVQFSAFREYFIILVSDHRGAEKHVLKDYYLSYCKAILKECICFLFRIISALRESYTDSTESLHMPFTQQCLFSLILKYCIHLFT